MLYEVVNMEQGLVGRGETLMEALEWGAGANPGDVLEVVEDGYTKAYVEIGSNYWLSVLPEFYRIVGANLKQYMEKLRK